MGNVNYNIKRKEFRKTKLGVITQIYEHQVQSSKARGHSYPSYTKDELICWLKNDWLFDLLYNNWFNCGRIKNIKPSLDRLDDSAGYSFSNIQIMTWKENNAKANLDNKNAKVARAHIAVNQYSKDGVFIALHKSMAIAARAVSSTTSNIRHCVVGDYHTAAGFKWKRA